MMRRQISIEVRSPREILRTFYDTYGWKVDPKNGRYLDQVLFVDPDQATRRYMERGEMRYRHLFRGGGRFFLDAGCGAKPRRGMSKNYLRHVCVDVSIVGLRECKRKLGESGDYVLADISRMPFSASVFAGALASHCIYHIESEKQFHTVSELCRVTQREKTVLLFYNSDYNLLSLVHKAVIGGLRLLRKLAGFMRSSDSKQTATAESNSPPPLYFHGHYPFSLVRGLGTVDITCLSALTRHETFLLRRLHLLNSALRLVTALEERFPHSMVLVGKYTAIRITVEA